MKHFIFLTVLVFAFCAAAVAQPNSNLELKKPPKFENQRLASEKTGEKKFTAPRSFIQNNTTHYNYFFNANARMEEIIVRAKASFLDDYSKLLPFYKYDLKRTAAFKTDLDSIIYKATAGILLHDLRNSFIDNLYLLIGEAYYFRNDLDSAYLTFQYLNYAFSPKEKDGWDKVIGSNSNEGGNVFSVSTKEKNSIVNKALTRPPSRNEAFIWQIRTYLARNMLTEASGLIETLKNDPLFPKRLDPNLHEMQALWFYKQNWYDSAAFHLEQSLGITETKQEQARLEYLIAQLHDKAGAHEAAKIYYERATKHTIDPLLEVYSILNGLRQGGSGNQKEVKVALDALIKMARKDKYFQYRDIVFYTAANIELEHNSPESAKLLLLKSVQFSMNNPAQKSTSYLALGDISFNQKKFVEAKEFYDSVNTVSIDPLSRTKFTATKLALDQIALNAGIVERQDSLQRIAAMPENERSVFLKGLAKQLRKKAGLKERELQSGSGSAIDLAGNKLPADLFGTTSKSEWYFSNANLKTKGYAEFRSRWGERSNSDNWRRSAAVSKQFAVNNNSGTNADINKGIGKIQDFSYDGLMANLPLTEDLKKISRDSTEHALFDLGKAYQNGLEEYNDAIVAYERMLSTYPASVHAEEAWFNLYYCYSKTGKASTLHQIKQTLSTKFPNGPFNAKLNNINGGISPDSLHKQEATSAYSGIYDLFLEGKFLDAIVQKRKADSLYGKNYWSPQLLYIEAVYYIRQRDDATSMITLNNIIALYPTSPLAEKSKTLLSVLGRRKEIENYLTNLQITRPDEDSSGIVSASPSIATPMPAKKEVVSKPILAAVTKDSAATVKKAPAKEVRSSAVKPDEAIVNKPVSPVVVPKAHSKDSSQSTKAPIVASTTYTRKPEQAHVVAFVMNKVDPVYVTEAKNAFNRYNKDAFSGRGIESTNLSLTDDIKMVLFQPFQNAAAAFEYVDNTRKMAAKNIIPWLKADKYFIIMISEENLELLKTKKDIGSYRKFLAEAYPDLGF